MGLLDKLKDLFMDEVIDDEEYELEEENKKLYEEPKKPEPPKPLPLEEGCTVQIIGTGNGSSYGTSNTAYGIGWTRQILKICR